MNGDERSSEAVSNDNRTGQCVVEWPEYYLPGIYHEVIVDGKVIYQGYDDREMVKAFRQACKTEAKLVSHFVNGTELDQSFLLGLLVPKC